MKRLVTQPCCPEVALLVSTYQKPEHLHRVLLSIALQVEVEGQIEVVVTDDGSTDRTRQVVETFAREVTFPVRFTTHPHAGFRLARCRNKGVAASSAPYLLFLDGDCVLPRDHVRQHLVHRHAGWVMGGYCCRLDREISTCIDEAAIQANTFPDLTPRSELKKLAWRDRKARFYNLIRHPGKPKLAGGNIGIWRSDFTRVNGYDERFIGWGGEDDDLRRRLAATGIRIGSILRWTHTYHLWHPPEPTAVCRYWDGQNVHYLHRPGRLVRCRDGLIRRTLDDIQFRIIGREPEMALARRLFAKSLPQILHQSNRGVPSAIPCENATLSENQDDFRPEVEILMAPGGGQFSGKADCQVLVILPEPVSKDAPRDRCLSKLARQAHRLLCDLPQKGFLSGVTQFKLNQIDQLLASIT
ncbi:MAG: glycosyltransferase [Pirellulales bacterium]|nr:glycosyltransferase [Pirellulales bacterium]